MNLQLVYPMAAMVLLTFGSVIRMFFGRVASVRAGESSAGYYKTYQEGGESRKAAQLSRQVINLFESPTLYYAACLAGLVIGQQQKAMLILAWVYVGCRIVHAIVHTGSNKLTPRIGSYFASWLVILGLWGTIVFGVATGQ